jgi:putative transposase
LALEPNAHKKASERESIVRSINEARERGLTVTQAAKELGICRSSYYRYGKSASEEYRRKARAKVPLMPSEAYTVKRVALDHPTTGYKRLTYLLQNEELAGVRAHQVYSLLSEEGLVGVRSPVGSPSLKRPEPASRPNQVWHIDIMYLRVSGRWLYLVDIIDAYSRYLVHWTLNLTMVSTAVTMSVQEALEKWLPPEPPVVVHDSGTQFLSREWRDFVSHRGIPNVRTRIAHPESNGILERLHRTHRAEALFNAEDLTCDQAQHLMASWAATYNERRPHLALHGLPPVVYYLGEPDAALAQREHYLQASAESRRNFWQQDEQVITR